MVPSDFVKKEQKLQRLAEIVRVDIWDLEV
jgi:hypothetical protein